MHYHAIKMGVYKFEMRAFSLFGQVQYACIHANYTIPPSIQYSTGFVQLHIPYRHCIFSITGVS